METKKHTGIYVDIGDTLKDKIGNIYEVVGFKKINNYNLGNSDSDKLVTLNKIVNLNNTHSTQDVSDIFLSNYIYNNRTIICRK